MQKFTALALAGIAQANYLSGEVRSQEWFKYGKFVAKMQNPNKMGTVQSFFTYTAQDWPHGWNEIDVEVVPSVTENPFSMNIIWKDGAQDHNYATGFNPKSDWFTYSVEWTPDYISWYINDKLVRKTEGTEDVHFLEHDTQLMMNFWTPVWSPWNDYFDDAEMPWYAKYDFVEVYDYNVDKKDFTLRWRDDFDTFDTKKWYASDNWGFENNSSLFMSSQVYVEDGNLVLKMDYNDGHARDFPAHHEVVHHEKPIHENPHAVKEHHEAKAPHHETPVVAHHEAPTLHHTAPVVHETVTHHAVPEHGVVTHEVVSHHADIDGHRYEAPLVHHSSYHHTESEYPHRYSEHGRDSHHSYPEHERAYTHEFKDSYHEGPHKTHTYETVKYESEYPSHHTETVHHQPTHYTAPAAEHHASLGERHYTSHDVAVKHDAYPHHGGSEYGKHWTDVKASQHHGGYHTTHSEHEYPRSEHFYQ